MPLSSEPPSSSLSSYAAITWLLGACCFGSLAAMRACDTLLPALADTFQVTVGQAARVIFVFAVAYGVFQLFFGPLGDRFGKLRVIALCALACVIGNGMAFLAPSLEWLVVARVVSGACAAGIFPLAMAWIGDNVPYATRQVALARLVSAGVAGMLAGQWLSGLIAEWVGWRNVFALIALVFLVAGGLLLSAARSDMQDRQDPTAKRHTFLDILRLPVARWILGVTLVEGMLVYGPVAFMPSLLQRQYGVSLATAGGIAACYGVGGFIYTRMAAFLLRRIGEAGLARLGGLFLCVGFATFAYAPVFAWTPVAGMLAGFGFYGLHNTLQTNATQMAPAARGVSMSLFACFLFLGQSVGVLVAAWGADLQADIWVFAGAGTGLLMLGLFIGRRFDPQRGRQPG